MSKEKFKSLLVKVQNETSICSFYHHACTFNSFKVFDEYCKENKDSILPLYAEFICNYPSMILFQHFSTLVKVKLPSRRINCGFVAYDVNEVWFSLIAFGIFQGYFSREFAFEKFFSRMDENKKEIMKNKLTNFLDGFEQQDKEKENL